MDPFTRGPADRARGGCPCTYSATSRASARTQALQTRGEVEDGRDPRSFGAANDTFKAICLEYLRRTTLRSKDWSAGVLERLVYPKFATRQIGDIKRSEIIRLLDKIEDDNGPVMADRTLPIRAVLRTAKPYSIFYKIFLF